MAKRKSVSPAEAQDTFEPDIKAEDNLAELGDSPPSDEVVDNAVPLLDAPKAFYTPAANDGTVDAAYRTTAAGEGGTSLHDKDTGEELPYIDEDVSPEGTDSTPMPDILPTEPPVVSDNVLAETSDDDVGPVLPHRRRERLLTIDARSEVQTEVDRDNTLWHEIQNAYHSRRILTGVLDGIERTGSGLTLAIVSYKGFRVVIPVKEMMLDPGNTSSEREYADLMNQFNRILNSRLGSEIDFIVKGYDNDSRSAVASRKEAMLRKRQTFYIDVDESGKHLIEEGRIVEARVVAVAEKVIRVEVFGVECAIVARNLSWEWIGNAREQYNVGDRILVRVQQIDRSDPAHLSISADVRSVSASTNRDNLKKCVPQSKYVGRVTDIRNGVVFIRLNSGVNAIAHTCLDRRTPGKNDDVSFAVTRLDEEQGVAVGIITRIIRQNL